MKKKYRWLLLGYYNLCLVADIFLLLPWLMLAMARWLARLESWAMMKERLGFHPHHHRATARLIGTKNIIWLHAPSLGETLSVLPIMTQLQAVHGDVFFIITCQSPSARQALMNFLLAALPQKNFSLALSPFDNLWLLKNQWRGLRPRFFFLGESDFLPRRATWLAVENIPAVLLNGRMSKKSFFFFTMFFLWGQVIFLMFDKLWAQSHYAQNYLSRLARKNILYHGNLKLFKKTERPNLKLVAFYKKNIPPTKQPLLFSCLHHGEEKMFFALYKKFPELKKYFFAIIVPRHPGRAIWWRSFPLRAAAAGLTKNDFLLVSSFGHLTSLYHLCRLVLLGGSWVNSGGHNPKEALDQGCVVLHGKYIGKSIDIYDDTDKRHVTFITHEPHAIYKKIIWFKKLSTQEQQRSANRAKKWQGSDQGNTTRKITSTLQPLINRAMKDD